MADIVDQNDTLNGYDDGGGNWLNQNGRCYIWDNTNSGTEQNFAGISIPGGAMEAGDDTVSSATIAWTFDTDNSGTSMTLRFRLVLAEDNAVWSGTNLPENATYVGSGEVTDTINPTSTSGNAYTSPDLSSLFQAFLDDAGIQPEDVGNLNIAVSSDTDTGEYCSIDGSANIVLNVAFTSGATITNVTITDEVDVSEEGLDYTYRNRLSSEDLSLVETDLISALRNSIVGEEIVVEDLVAAGAIRNIWTTDNLDLFELFFKQVYLNRINEIDLSEERYKELLFDGRLDSILISESTEVILSGVTIVIVAIQESISVSEVVSPYAIRNTITEEYLDVLEIVRQSVIRNKIRTEDVAVIEDMIKTVWLLRIISNSLDVSELTSAQVIRFLNEIINIKHALVQLKIEHDVVRNLNIVHGLEEHLPIEHDLLG